jgi:hypothetical protein
MFRPATLVLLAFAHDREAAMDDRDRMARRFVFVVGAVVLVVVAGAALAETPQIIWTWTFTPAPSWDNVMSVLGGPDLNRDGYPDALVASEDRYLSALSGHSTGTPATIWEFGGNLEVPVNENAIALYPDRDGDGNPEIVYTTGYADRSVYLIRSRTGVPYWTVTVADTGCTESAWFWDAVPLSDIDDDGVTDVVAAIGALCSRVIALSGADGSLIWQYLAGDGCRAVVDAGDLTGDGYHDVLASSGSNFEDNKLFLLSGAPGAVGRLVWEHEAGSFVDGATMVQDFTGDGVDEAIGGSWDHTVFAVSGASSGTVPTPLWETAVSGGTGWVQDTIRMPDLDDDCVDDVAVASWTPTTRILSGRTGDTLWSQPVGTATNAAYGAAVPDLTVRVAVLGRRRREDLGVASPGERAIRGVDRGHRRRRATGHPGRSAGRGDGGCTLRPHVPGLCPAGVRGHGSPGLASRQQPH